MVAKRSGSYPYRYLAEDFGLPYWAVLSYKQTGYWGDEAMRVVHFTLARRNPRLLEQFQDHLLLAENGWYRDENGMWKRRT